VGLKELVVEDVGLVTITVKETVLERLLNMFLS
jgi:hypothetical protein